MSATTHSEALRAAAEIADGLPDAIRERLYINVDASLVEGAVVRMEFFLSTQLEQEQPSLARDIMRVLGGTWDKKVWQDTLDLTQRRNDGVRVFIRMGRDSVCKRVVTGTHQVERIFPAVEAAPRRVVVETVEDVEWDCSPLLAAAEGASA